MADRIVQAWDCHPDSTSQRCAGRWYDGYRPAQTQNSDHSPPSRGYSLPADSRSCASTQLLSYHSYGFLLLVSGFLLRIDSCEGLARPTSPETRSTPCPGTLRVVPYSCDSISSNSDGGCWCGGASCAGGSLSADEEGVAGPASRFPARRPFSRCR